MKNHYLILIIIHLLFCYSCVKNIDLEQVENLELAPVVVVTLVNVNIKQTSIISSLRIEETMFKVTSKFDFFTAYELENVERMTIDFDITNLFNRRFSILLTFLEGNSLETYELPMIIIPEKVTHQKVSHEIRTSNLPLILNTKSLEVTVKLLPSTDGSVININDDKTFKFNSSGIFYFKIN